MRPLRTIVWAVIAIIVNTWSAGATERPLFALGTETKATPVLTPIVFGKGAYPSLLCQLGSEKGFLEPGLKVQDCVNAHWRAQFKHMSWTDYAARSRTMYVDGGTYYFPINAQAFMLAMNDSPRVAPVPPALATLRTAEPVVPLPVKKLEDGQADLARQLQAAEARIAVLEATPPALLTETVEVVKQLEAEQGDLSDRLGKAETALTTLREENAALTAKNVALEGRLGRAEATIAELRAELDRLVAARPSQAPTLDTILIHAATKDELRGVTARVDEHERDIATINVELGELKTAGLLPLFGWDGVDLLQGSMTRLSAYRDTLIAEVREDVTRIWENRERYLGGNVLFVICLALAGALLAFAPGAPTRREVPG